MAWATVMVSELGGITGDTTAPKTSFPRQLWRQIFHLLSWTALFTGIITVIIYMGAWLFLLSRLEPTLQNNLRIGLEAKLPDSFHLMDQLPLRGWFLLMAAITMLVGAFICTTVAALVARRLVRPLGDLAASLHRLAGGDLATRHPLAGAGALLDLVGDVNAIAQRLEQTEFERRLTAAAVAHDLRTPLAVLRARLDGLEDGIFRPEPAEFARLHHQLDLMEHLVNDLQLLSLAEAGGLRLHCYDLDLAALLNEVLDDLTPLFERQQVRLLRQQPTTSLHWHGDGARLRQICLNLLDNALRHTPAGGTIAVTLIEKTTSIQLEVADSGVGVADSERDKLFGRFYRAESSRSRSTGGSGLGLAIVRALVEAHSGSVRAERAVLGGLGVVVVLPYSPVLLYPPTTARPSPGG
jgi:two-component system, OmpR family, sensor histidine kinase BaeS